MSELQKTKDEWCAVCQFCTYEDGRPPEAFCHNEHSQNYGKMLSQEDIEKPACVDFSPHIYKDLSLKDALKIIGAGTNGFIHCSNLPNKKYRPYLVINFESNKQVEDWRDALTRLFFEYMDMAEKDGDFKNEPD